MRFLIIFILLSQVVHAKKVAEPMTVTKKIWSSEKKMYRLTMLRHAAIYWAPKSLEECISKSLRTQKDFLLSFDTKNLELFNCKEIN